MDELKLPPDTPIQYEEGLWELCTDKAYEMMSQITKQPLSKVDILSATENYLSMCSDETNKYCTWGDGDSLDRERVRDILLDDYNYKFVGE